MKNFIKIIAISMFLVLCANANDLNKFVSLNKIGISFAYILRLYIKKIEKGKNEQHIYKQYTSS